MLSIFRVLIVLVVSGSLVALYGLPNAHADYPYVDLAYLAAHKSDYLWTLVSTTGRVRTDIFKIPEQIGQVFLATSESSYVGVWLVASGGGLKVDHGSFINISGTMAFDPLFTCYYFLVEEYGPAIEWNPADVNFDLKVDILDCVRFVSAYGSTPSSSNWNPYCDVASPYEVINLFDVMTMVASYGDEYP